MNNSKKNVVLCANPEKGHYFDGNRYEKCPFCGYSKKSSDEQSQNVYTEKKQKSVLGLFYKKNKDYRSISRTMDLTSSGEKKEEKELEENEKSNNAGFIFTPTEKIEPEELANEEEYDTPNNESGYDSVNECDEASDNTVEHKQENTDNVSENEVAEDVKNRNAIQEDKPSDEMSYLKEQKKTAQTGGLADVIKKASANTEGKTMSYFDSAKKSAEKEKSKNIDPVVGWLVCVEGAHFGESFNISAGMNSMGRNDSNRIVLSMDSSVSREKHAFITYEPRKRRFFVKPGDSSGLTYVNDEYITESIVIKAMDIIELGNSKFVLIPLCGENFSWEDYISKE